MKPIDLLTILSLLIFAAGWGMQLLLIVTRRRHPAVHLHFQMTSLFGLYVFLLVMIGFVFPESEGFFDPFASRAVEGDLPWIPFILSYASRIALSLQTLSSSLLSYSGFRVPFRRTVRVFHRNVVYLLMAILAAELVLRAVFGESAVGPIRFCYYAWYSIVFISGGRAMLRIVQNARNYVFPFAGTVLRRALFFIALFLVLIISVSLAGLIFSSEFIDSYNRVAANVAIVILLVTLGIANLVIDARILRLDFADQHHRISTVEELEELQLHERERVILRELLQGRLNKEIAYDLGLSQNTVRNYIYSLYKKLQISSRKELLKIIDKNLF